MDIPKQFKILKILALFVLIFSAKQVCAQSNYWDVIMLKSAEVIRGTITDSIPAESVTILAGDSLSRTIPNEEITLITKEVRRYAFRKKEVTGKKSYSTERSAYYQGILSLGFGIPLSESSVLNVNFINGFGFSDVLSMGVGIGLRLPLEREAVIIPLFFDLRLRPMNTRISPVFVLGLGGSFQPNLEWENTGPILMLKGGISIKNSGKSSVMITIGYENFDILNTEENRRGNIFTGFGSSESRETIRTLTLNFAVAF